MSDRRSLAERAVETLAMVRDMENGIDKSKPERFIVWGLKNVAEQILGDAFARANDLAIQALRVKDQAAKGSDT